MNDEGTKIKYLEDCNEDVLYWIREIFEDVSANLISQKFIDSLRRLNKQFLKLEIMHDIDVVESCFYRLKVTGVYGGLKVL